MSDRIPLSRSAARLIVIDRDDRVLLIEGRDSTRPESSTWWITPGGGLDEGESLEQAARRELLEETGLEIATGRVLAIVPDRYGQDGVPTLNIFYVAQVVEGDAQPASDVAEIGWFDPDALPPRGQIAFDCVAEVLARWRPDRG
jgi:8-oxo-dGTP pyrophosphatase MutT (NUDIX family)